MLPLVYNSKTFYDDNLYISLFLNFTKMFQFLCRYRQSQSVLPINQNMFGVFYSI